MVDINQQINETSGVVNFKVKEVKVSSNNTQSLDMPTTEINFVANIVSDHNTISSAHENRFGDVYGNIGKIKTAVALKADAVNTYTKTEMDLALSKKVDTSDLSVTKQGNTFNGINQLLQLDSSGKLPALDGSQLTNIIPIDTIIDFGAISSGSITLTQDKFHKVTFFGASTIAFPSNLKSGILYNCTLLVTMSSVVAITQPSVIWAYGASPTLTSTTAKYRLTYETSDGGATWYGYWTQLGN